MPPEVDIIKNFRVFDLTWKFLGMQITNKKYALLLRFYDLIITIVISAGFDLHLILKIFQISSAQELFHSLLYISLVLVINIKLIVFRCQFSNVDQMKALYSELDENIMRAEEITYHRKAMKRLMKLAIYPAYGSYLCNYGFGVMSALFLREERTLICNGWFPFDWKSSKLNYFYAISYQTIAGFILVSQCYACDTFGPVALGTLSEHVQIFSMRLMKTELDEKTTEEQYYAQLKKFAKDYERLMRLAKKLQEIISLNALAQFLTSGVEICMTVVLIGFYLDNFQDIFRYSLVLLCLSLQSFPICYFGSVVQTSFEKLPYAFFSTDWIDRNIKFRHGLIL